MEVTPLATSEGFGKLLSLVKGKISGRADLIIRGIEYEMRGNIIAHYL